MNADLFQIVDGAFAGWDDSDVGPIVMFLIRDGVLRMTLGNRPVLRPVLRVKL